MDRIPNGLTPQEVVESHQQYGANIDTRHDFTTLKIVSKTLFSLFNMILVVFIIVLLLVHQKTTAQFIGLVAFVNTIIEIIQEIRAHFIVKKLTQRTEKIVKVIRSGTSVTISIAEIVMGDVISLASGDRVPVDGVVVHSEYAEFDESILTGESQYVEKKTDEVVRAGSFVAAGSCYYKVTKLSKDSYIQSVTKEIAHQPITQSPLQSQINQIITTLTYMTLFFIVLIVAEGFIQENQKEEIIINSATLVTSMVPQGLVLITTLSFAYGATRIAKNQAVVQKLSAIESMANTNVVCMDKTGTLTKNIFEIKEIHWM